MVNEPRSRPRNSLRDLTLPDDSGGAVVGLGPLAVLLVAAVLVPVRDTVGVTNVALAMAVVVVIAAMTSRTAGIVTAVVAAVSYNFFHTEPYRSLRINRGQDIATVVLLLLLGLIVSEISARSRAARHMTERHTEAEHALEVTSEMLASGATFAELWDEVDASLRRVLRVDECRFEPGSTTTLPLISRVGSMSTKSRTWTGAGFELPETGAAIPVVYAGETLGHIVLRGRSHAGSVRDERRVAVALADHLAIGIAGTAHDVS